jgi:hypothetical protein
MEGRQCTARRANAWTATIAEMVWRWKGENRIPNIATLIGMSDLPGDEASKLLAGWSRLQPSFNLYRTMR